MPAVRGRVQLAATRGAPAGLNAAAVRRAGPHRRPAAEAARVWRVASLAQPVPPGPDSSAPPLASSASKWDPPGAAARASGTSASAAPSRPGLQAAPLSWVAASGEKDRSWLGRNPATSDPAPGLATTRPPLLA